MKSVYVANRKINSTLIIKSGEMLVLTGNTLNLNADLIFEDNSALKILEKCELFYILGNNNSSIYINSSLITFENIVFSNLGSIKEKKSCLNFKNNTNTHNKLFFYHCNYYKINLLDSSKLTLDQIYVDTYLNILNKDKKNNSKMKNIKIIYGDYKELRFDNFKFMLENIPTNFSWIAVSVFNYKNPSDSYLNLAYPSAIAYYYAAIVPSNSKYTFKGSFLQADVYESSLTVYNNDGTLDENYDSLNNYNTPGEINFEVSASSELKFVLQRFYVNLNAYTEDLIYQNLLNVYDSNNNLLPKLSIQEQKIVSKILNIPIDRLVLNNSVSLNESTFTKFYLPGSVGGVFPANSHYYLISSMGSYKNFKITGSFTSSNNIPYIDFLIGNQTNTETQAGIPFYDFIDSDNTYTIYVYSDTSSSTYDSNNNNLIIDSSNNSPLIIFRMINFSSDGITQATGPLTAAETEDVMTSGFYPTITPIDT